VSYFVIHNAFITSHYFHFTAFSAFTLLTGHSRNEGHVACKIVNWWDANVSDCDPAELDTNDMHIS